MAQYDDIKMRVPKGCRELIQQHADSLGYSTSELLNRLVSDELGIDFETWWYGETDGQPRRLGRFKMLKAKFPPIFPPMIEAFCRKYRISVAESINKIALIWMQAYAEKREAEKETAQAGQALPAEQQGGKAGMPVMEE